LKPLFTKIEVQVLTVLHSPLPETFNHNMVFHSVAVAGGIIVAIALALAIHRCWVNYQDKKRHGG
jgi:hypothetical protein